MRTMTCETAREMIQTAHDSGGTTERTVREHVSACLACARFQEFVQTLGGHLRAGLDAHNAGGPVPDASLLVRTAYSRRKKRRSIYCVSGLAAALVIGLGGLSGVSLARKAQIEQYVNEETHYFIEDLFSEPLCEGIEYVTINE